MVITADPELEYLDTVRDLITPAFSDDDNWQDLTEKLRTNYAQLWVVLDPDPIAAAVTEIGGGEAHFWLAGGERAREWASPLAEGVCALTGMDKATIRGRIGWARLLRWEIIERQGRNALMRRKYVKKENH